LEREYLANVWGWPEWTTKIVFAGPESAAAKTLAEPQFEIVAESDYLVGVFGEFFAASPLQPTEFKSKVMPPVPRVGFARSVSEQAGSKKDPREPSAVLPGRLRMCSLTHLASAYSFLYGSTLILGSLKLTTAKS
jgi:hypothetical protein